MVHVAFSEVTYVLGNRDIRGNRKCARGHFLEICTSPPTASSWSELSSERTEEIQDNLKYK